jgi:hypothetical protein
MFGIKTKKVMEVFIQAENDKFFIDKGEIR